MAYRGHKRDQAFSLRRALQVLVLLCRTLFQLPFSNVLYVTISQSRLGFIKDAVPLFLARWLGKPAVAHLHGGNFSGFYETQPRGFQLLVRRALGRVSAIVVLADTFRNEFDMIPGGREKIQVIANPCEIEPLQERTAPSGTLRVLYLSNLVVEKGYLDVLAACSPLAQRLGTWKIEFHFAGAFALGRDDFASVAAMEEDFARRASAFGPTASVQWHGVVDGEAKQLLLERCDVFVLPTYFINEGQPIALLEAMAVGLPVVATRHRAIPETLPPEMSCLLVPTKDPGAIADRLARLALTPGLYEACSRAAVLRAREFSPERYIGRLEAVLLDSVAKLGGSAN